MADFTDCEMSDLSVGTPVEMAFRRHYVDETRGFTGYFWKAVPRKAEAHTEREAEAGQAEIRFDDQVAVVTGAGGGLGRIYALELATARRQRRRQRPRRRTRRHRLLLPPCRRRRPRDHRRRRLRRRQL